MDSPDGRPGRSQASGTVRRSRDPEVADLQLAGILKEQIRGLKIPVDDMTGMRCLESFGDLYGYRKDGIDRQAARRLLQNGGKVLAMQQLHHNERLAVI
jgi:hypothetical protein